jgi:UDP-N-acetylmuramoyl-L-alanyl-D-glutamate--2,6-diaminopimelate ligase
MEDVAFEHQPAGEALDATVTGLEYDSRRIRPGDVYFAFAGSRTDGRLYAPGALAQGAVAVLSELPPLEGFRGPWVQVRHGRQALAMMARRFYREAAEAVAITGATGTNGKSTTCVLADTILRTAGHVTALIGTIHYHVAGELRKAVNTTPESLDVYRLLQELKDAGGSHAIMEVSSHALALGRVHGVRFHTAIFTNLTRDHLDFHSTMEDYFTAKCELFRGQQAPPPRYAVLNADDEWAGRVPIASGTETIRYGLSSGAALRAERVQATFEGLRFTMTWQGASVEIASSLVGRMNVYNILAACGAGLSYGLPLEKLAEGVRACRSVPGRFERVEAGQPFLVVVDYAHTDDALRNAIAAARGLKPRRVITVFGCGGDRDRAKRPLMGQAAGEASDFVVLTSDNPRSEDPLTIINDALVGLRRTDVEHRVEPDRTAAIRIALQEAGEGDVVLIAGKGHETYQVLRDRTIDYDDRAVARSLLEELGFSRRIA